MNPGAADTRRKLEGFLRRAAGADAVHLRDITRLSGGAVQENWALDADMTGGTHPGPHQWVLRTDAAARVEASLPRRQEFEILKVAHGFGLFCCQRLAQVDAVSRDDLVQAVELGYQLLGSGRADRGDVQLGDHAGKGRAGGELCSQLALILQLHATGQQLGQRHLVT